MKLTFERKGTCLFYRLRNWTRGHVSLAWVWHPYSFASNDAAWAFSFGPFTCSYIKRDKYTDQIRKMAVQS